MTDLILRAKKFASAKHAGLVDKHGEPYIGHLARVAARLPDRLKAAGWLHDVIEDTTATADDLRAAGFDEETVGLVLAVTRDKKSGTYDSYLDKVIAAGPDAVALKLADLADNTDRTRGPVPGRLTDRYEKAKEKLGAAAAAAGGFGSG
jgi:(p)ppGpp synthase/HD superfamily hydrolase